MKHLLLLMGLILLSSCGSYTCEDFRIGEFRYSDPSFQDVVITRDSLTQVEVKTEAGESVKDVYSIYWDGPCSYTLVMKESSHPSKQFHSKYDTIKVRIREITDDGYIFHTLLGGKEVEGEMILND